MTTRERILALADGGHEPHMIAALLDLDVTDVAETLALPEHTPSDPAEPQWETIPLDEEWFEESPGRRCRGINENSGKTARFKGGIVVKKELAAGAVLLSLDSTPGLKPNTPRYGVVTVFNEGEDLLFVAAVYVYHGIELGDNYSGPLAVGTQFFFDGMSFELDN